MIGYNHTIITIEAKNADSLALKSPSSAVKIYQFIDGKCEINTADFTPNEYSMQYFKGDSVIYEDTLIIKQNLKYADANYNPKSIAKQILEAIEARLQNTATNSQLYVKVGEKEIRYMDYSELIKWRNFYQKQVAKENGKPTQIKHEKLYYREYLRGGII